MGYDLESRTYRIYKPSSRRVLRSRNVMFIESPPDRVLNAVDYNLLDRDAGHQDPADFTPDGMDDEDEEIELLF